MSRIAALALLLASATTSFGGPTPSAAEVMRHVEERNRGQAFKCEYEMINVTKDGGQKERVFYWWRKQYGNDAKSLLKFKSPATLAGSGLLSFSHDKSDDEQWVFLSEAPKKEARRVAAQDRGNSFLGSEFYYIDFEKMKEREFDHKLIKEERVEGKNTLVIESIPKKAGYVYEKVISWVDPANNVQVKIDFYRNGAHAKTLTVKALEQVDGVWTSKLVEMKTMMSGKSTLMKIKEIKFNQGLQDSLFTQKMLVKDL